MNRSRLSGLVGAVALSVLTLAGCASTAKTSSDTPAPPATSAAASVPVDITSASTALGEVVVTANGLTAYYFDMDTPNSGTSACTGPCAQVWPAITTTAESPSVSGVTGHVATIATADGKKQITIDGRPIYTFAYDKKPGDVTGQGSDKAWHVVAPSGAEITDAKP